MSKASKPAKPAAVEPEGQPAADAVVTIAEGKHMRLVRRGRWEYAERRVASGAVVIIAITREQNLILIEQFRVPVNQRVIELPAGLVGDLEDMADEDGADAAGRELIEETGYQAKSVKLLTRGPISAGFGNEMIALYRATGVKKIAAGGGVEGENILVHEVPLASVTAWLKRKAKAGLLIDPKVYAGLFFAQ